MGTKAGAGLLWPGAGEDEEADGGTKQPEGESAEMGDGGDHGVTSPGGHGRARRRR